MVRHVPNTITICRGLCGPAIAALLVLPTEPHHLVAFWWFLAAIVTDLLDGLAARLLDAFHPAGLWLDPLADKVLTDATWIALGWVGFAPLWLCAAVLVRDVVVLSVWGYVLATGSQLRWSPTPVGQTMVAFEGVALCVLLFHGPWLDVHWPSVGTVLGVIGLALSLTSLLQYAVHGPEPS